MSSAIEKELNRIARSSMNDSTKRIAFMRLSVCKRIADLMIKQNISIDELRTALPMSHDELVSTLNGSRDISLSTISLMEGFFNEKILYVG